MAVTLHGPQVVKLAAANDEYAPAGGFRLAQLIFDHTAAGSAVISIDGGSASMTIRSTANELTKTVPFNPPIHCKSVKPTTMAAGTLVLILE